MSRALDESVDRQSKLASPATRWGQLGMAVLTMMMISSMQYDWTLFVNPIQQAYGWSRAEIQTTFTIFILLNTWLVPFGGYAIDRFGVRPLLSIASVLIALGWVVSSYASSLEMLYFGGALGGTGVGIIDIAAITAGLKWFPDRRGLAVGLASAGYGLGALLTIGIVSYIIDHHSYQAAFFWVGIGQGIIVFLCAMKMRVPRPEELPVVTKAAVAATARNYTPKEVLKEPVFYALYLSYVLMCAGGLMMAAQTAPLAKDWGIATTPSSFLGFTATTLVVALMFGRIMNGISRPLFGFISDHLGRENTMFIGFMGEAVAVYLLYAFGSHPVAFIILIGVFFLFWGEIFSLYPALVTDLWGPAHVNTNYGMIFTGKGTGSFLVPIANLLMVSTGGWGFTFGVVIVFSVVAALLALFVVKPARIRMSARSAAAMSNSSLGQAAAAD